MSEVQGHGINPCKSFRLLPPNPRLIIELVEVGPFSSLRVVSVTGAVLTPPMFEYTFNAFGRKVYLISTSGGTDIFCSCESEAHLYVSSYIT